MAMHLVGRACVDGGGARGPEAAPGRGGCLRKRLGRSWKRAGEELEAGWKRGGSEFRAGACVEQLGREGEPGPGSRGAAVREEAVPPLRDAPAHPDPGSSPVTPDPALSPPHPRLGLEPLPPGEVPPPDLELGLLPTPATSSR